MFYLYTQPYRYVENLNVSRYVVIEALSRESAEIIANQLGIKLELFEDTKEYRLLEEILYTYNLNRDSNRIRIHLLEDTDDLK